MLKAECELSEFDIADNLHSIFRSIQIATALSAGKSIISSQSCAINRLSYHFLVILCIGT